MTRTTTIDRLSATTWIDVAVVVPHVHAPIAAHTPDPAGAPNLSLERREDSVANGWALHRRWVHDGNA